MKHQDGFSLIEILAVLVIMGLLISVVAPTVLNSADDARIQKVQADFKAIETALKKINNAPELSIQYIKGIFRVSDAHNKKARKHSLDK